METSTLRGCLEMTCPKGLLWKGNGAHGQRQRRIPSWSWASVDGGVISLLMLYSIENKAVEVLANVEDVQVVLVDPNNRYGQVASGRLVIKGMVLPWNKEWNQKGGSSNDGKVVREAANETDEETAEDQAPIRGSGGETSWLYAKDHTRALDSGFGTLFPPKSNDRLFVNRFHDPHGVEFIGYHQGFRALLEIRYDERMDQDQSKMNRSFLLPILERI